MPGDIPVSSIICRFWDIWKPMPFLPTGFLGLCCCFWVLCIWFGKERGESLLSFLWCRLLFCCSCRSTASFLAGICLLSCPLHFCLWRTGWWRRRDFLKRCWQGSGFRKKRRKSLRRFLCFAILLQFLAIIATIWRTMTRRTILQ